MGKEERCLVYVTTANEEEARAIGRRLVEEGLAACVNVLPRITSFYRWEGALQEDTEVLFLAKTRRSALPAIIELVTAMHTYSVPAITAFPIIGGFDKYLHWIDEEVEPAGDAGG